MAHLEALLARALELDTLDKVRLIGSLTPMIEEELSPVKEEPRKSYPSLWGAFRCLGTAPSIADIEEARREMWPAPAEGETG